MRPPGSKSITNRALVCAALADGVSTLTGALDSEDTRVMLESLVRLGIEVEARDSGQTLVVTWLSRAGARTRGRPVLRQQRNDDPISDCPGYTRTRLLSAGRHCSGCVSDRSMTYSMPSINWGGHVGANSTMAARQIVVHANGLAGWYGEIARRYFQPVLERLVNGCARRAIFDRAGH